MTIQETGNGFFIFFRRKGACGIDQSAAGTNQHSTGIQDLRLPPCAHGHRFRTPICYCRFFLAEQSLAGARGINEHTVKKTGISLRQLLGVFVGYQRIGYAHALNITA